MNKKPLCPARRFLLLLCAALLLLFCCSCGEAELIASGKTDGVVWALDSDGCLSFSGTGTIPGEEYQLDPTTGLSTAVRPAWFEYRDSTTEIRIGREIEYISMNAFLGFDRVLSLDISASVRRIDGNAFAGCTALERVTVRGQSTTLERFCIGYTGAFADENLTEITFRGAAGSTIERYAAACGAKFEAL